MPTPDKEARALGIEYREADWPHGLRCSTCDHLFHEPDRYSEQLDGFINGHPTVLIRCLGCALKPATTEDTNA